MEQVTWGFCFLGAMWIGIMPKTLDSNCYYSNVIWLYIFNHYFFNNYLHKIYKMFPESFALPELCKIILFWKYWKILSR